MLETSRLPKGEKGKERRGISVLKQTRRSPDRCWEKGRGLALEGMVPRRAGRGAIPREGGGHGERWRLHLQGWVCPSTSLCRQASCFPIPGGRDVPGNTPKKLLPGGETGGQELWGHSVSLHQHLNQLECWHQGLALGWSPPPAPGCLTARSAGPQRGKQSQSRPAKPQVPCCLPPAWGGLSKEEKHTQRPLLSKDQSQLQENPLGWQRRN